MPICRLPLIFAAALLIAATSSTPAAAVLVNYQLTFTGSAAADDGVGTLVLNLPSLPDNGPINFTSLPDPIFSSLSATIGGVSFNLTNANIAFGGVQGTGSNSIDFAATESTQGFAVGTPFLALFNGAPNAGTFQIQPFNEGGSFPQGSFVIGGPVAAVPEISTWVMLILGFAALSLISSRFRRRAAQAT